MARVDLKADRSVSTLRVQSSFAESEMTLAEVAAALAAELRAMAAWLELDQIEVVARGNLATPLQSALG